MKKENDNIDLNISVDPVPMNLDETIPYMISSDYQHRFQAEYFQLKIRRDKLDNMLHNWKNLPFNPKCSKQLLRRQLLAMDMYLDALKERAQIEGVDISIDAVIAMQVVRGSQDIINEKYYPVEEILAKLKGEFSDD